MTITLTPEIERALTARATQQGTTPELLALHDLRELYTEASPPDSFKGKAPYHSILELEGLGAEIWKDDHGAMRDAQEYVNELRHEWDHRS